MTLKPEKETKQAAGGQEAQKSEFMKRIEAMAAEMRALAKEDKERREVFLVACEHHAVKRLLVGDGEHLTSNVASAMIGDEVGREAMLRIFKKWLEMLDGETAVAVLWALCDTVHEANVKTQHSRAEA